MANLDGWLNQSNSGTINAASRATDAWNRIQRNPTSVTLVRGQVELDAQTVRIEFGNMTSSNSEVKGDGAGSSARRNGIVFGVKNHPTVDDTDIQRSDRFAISGQHYRVVQVINVPGEVQATVEVLS